MPALLLPALELRNHHSPAEPPEVTAVLAGRTGGEPARNLIELLAISKAFHDLFCLVFCLDKDM